MGAIKGPQPVKLIVGMLSQSEELFEIAEGDMAKLWDEIDIKSECMPHTFTDYYKSQMGTGLLRKFVSFDKLIDPGDIASIKHKTNELEDKYAKSEPGRALGVDRCINLDPGYVEPSKLILATTKNFSHRIYIGNSVWAECTLHYRRGKWEGWPYSFPDYSSGCYDQFLSNARDRLVEQTNQK